MGKQKFFRGQTVRLASTFPPEMSHFDGKGCKAIVIGSYSDQFGGGDFSSYTLLIIPKGTKKIKEFFSCSWYHDYQMTLVSDARRKGEEIIQKYNEWWAEHPDGDLTPQEITELEIDLYEGE